MSSNPILSNINAIMPQANQQVQLESFDLSDDTFAKVLDKKLDGLEENDTSQSLDDIVKQLGMPAGLHIEGFDYNDMLTNPISSTERVDAVNTDSDVNNDSKFNLKSLVKDAVNTFSPLAGSVLSNGISVDTLSQTASSIKTFWSNQTQNLYATMNKETVDDITELISKL